MFESMTSLWVKGMNTPDFENVSTERVFELIDDDEIPLDKLKKRKKSMVLGENV